MIDSLQVLCRMSRAFAINFYVNNFVDLEKFPRIKDPFVYLDVYGMGTIGYT